MACKKPAAKTVKVKDVQTKKSPKGGMIKSDRPLATPRVQTTMQDVVNAKLSV